MIFTTPTSTARAAFENISDVNVFTLNINGVKIFVKQLTGSSDKGRACQVLLLAGGFAHKHQIGIGVAYAKHQFGACLAKRTALTVTTSGAEFF